MYAHSPASEHDCSLAATSAALRSAVAHTDRCVAAQLSGTGALYAVYVHAPADTQFRLLAAFPPYVKQASVAEAVHVLPPPPPSEKVQAPEPPAALSQSERLPAAVAQVDPCVATHDSCTSVTNAVYVHSPAVSQALRLVSSSGEDINEGSEHVDSAVAAQASATIAANAVYAHPPAFVHDARFSLAVPVKLTELHTLDTSSSY